MYFFWSKGFFCLQCFCSPDSGDACGRHVALAAAPDLQHLDVSMSGESRVRCGGMVSGLWGLDLLWESDLRKGPEEGRSERR